MQDDLTSSRLNVIGYTRVSTDEQANSGLSLASQEMRLRAYAAATDLILTDIIEDAGCSAKDLNRPGMQRILGRIEDQKTDGILILKLDRLTRSVRDLGLLIDLCEQHGVALMAVQESINTATAAGRLVTNVLVSVAQWECEVIGERTKSALAVKRMRGEKTGGLVPYGYTSTNGRLHVNKSEQAVIQLMIQLRLEHHSYNDIAKLITERGHLSRLGKSWHPQTVHRILERSHARWVGADVS